MIITPEALDIFFSDLQADYLSGYKAAPSYYEQFCRVKQSKGRDSRYGWMDRIPNFREWIGERHIEDVVGQEYTIANKLWELTCGIKRTSLEDDIYNFFGATPKEIGKQAKILPDLRVIYRMQNGTGAGAVTFDSVPFYSGSHPIDTTNPAKGTLSNNFDSSTSGVTPLTQANAAAIIAAMGEVIGRDGNPFGFWPNIVMVPPALVFSAHQVFDMQFVTQALALAGVASGVATTENALRGSCKVLGNEWLASTPNDWFMIDTREEEFRPFTWQLRMAPEFVWLNRPDDEHVFMQDQYLYGGRMRGDAGYGLWFTSSRASNS
ncbi:MAG: Mu-like prophage major head subunit gpT family protein [Thermoplasmataceae archaeon]